MGKLTGRSAIVTADVDEDLLIHVVDTSGTPASFKATLSQLYAVFPKNSSAGASDVNKVPKWTAENELGASIIEDNGSKATIGGVLSLEGTGAGKLNLVNTVAQDTSGSNYMNWYESDGTSRRGYLGFTDPNTFNINVQESAGTSQIVLDADEIIFNSVDGTDSSTITTGVWQGTPIADAYIAEDYLTATSGAAQRLAVFDGTDSVEGDDNLTYTGSTLKINSNNALSPNNFSSITGNYLASQVETDDANCLLYGYGTSNSGELILASARGTIATPTAVQSGDSLGEVQGFGHTGTGFRQGGRMLFLAGENYQEGTNYGTTFSLRLTPNGSAAAVTRYEIDGDGDHTFTGNVKVDGQAYSDIAATVTPSALAATIDWDNGNMQVLDMTSNINTLTINNPKAGASYFIKIIQSVGGATITWPAAVKWAENDEYAGSVGAGDIDAVALTYDGANYLANYSLDYQ